MASASASDRLSRRKSLSTRMTSRSARSRETTETIAAPLKPLSSKNAGLCGSRFTRSSGNCPSWNCMFRIRSGHAADEDKTPFLGKNTASNSMNVAPFSVRRPCQQSKNCSLLRAVAARTWLLAGPPAGWVSGPSKCVRKAKLPAAASATQAPPATSHPPRRISPPAPHRPGGEGARCPGRAYRPDRRRRAAASGASRPAARPDYKRRCPGSPSARCGSCGRGGSP